MVHLEVCKYQGITHLKGFYNLDKTLDSEFYCLKCFVLKLFQEPNTILLFTWFLCDFLFSKWPANNRNSRDNEFPNSMFY